ncbi:cobalt ECF transporter T component CbiQ [Halanaerocella petrolearia]
MMNHKLAQGNSWVHQLDPRLKVVLAFVLTVVAASGYKLVMLAQILVVGLLLVLAAQLDLKYVANRLLVVNSFIFFIWLIVPFTYPGDFLREVGPLVISKEGLIYALQITIRANSILLVLISLLSTTSLVELTYTFTYLKLPRKLIYLFFLVYRYFDVIKEEYQKLYNAMLLRGFKNKTSLHTYKSYAYLLGMLLVKSYDRAQQVYEAMLCRGFKGQFYLQDDFQFSSLDFIMMLGSLVVVSWLIILDKGGY